MSHKVRVRWCKSPVVRHCLVRVALCGGGDSLFLTAGDVPEGLHPPLSPVAPAFLPPLGVLQTWGPEANLSPSCNNTSSSVASKEWCQFPMCQPACPLKRTRANILETAVAVPQRARRELLVAACCATRAPQHSVKPVTEQNIQLLLASPLTHSRVPRLIKRKTLQKNLAHGITSMSMYSSDSAAYHDRVRDPQDVDDKTADSESAGTTIERDAATLG